MFCPGHPSRDREGVGRAYVFCRVWRGCRKGFLRGVGTRRESRTGNSGNLPRLLSFFSTSTCLPFEGKHATPRRRVAQHLRWRRRDDTRASRPLELDVSMATLGEWEYCGCRKGFLRGVGTRRESRTSDACDPAIRTDRESEPLMSGRIYSDRFIVFRVATFAVSVLALGTLGSLSCVSCATIESWEWSSASERHNIISHDGAIVWSWYDAHGPRRSVTHEIATVEQRSRRGEDESDLLMCGVARFWAPGVHLESTGGNRWSRSWITLPYWLTFMPPAFCLWRMGLRRRRMRRRLDQGRCAFCGFDLRGHRVRCSECGEAPATRLLY